MSNATVPLATSCPSPDMGLCERTGLVISPDLCQLCGGHPDYLLLRFERAKQKKCNSTTSAASSSPIVALILQYCGQICGGLRNQDLQCPAYGKPCKIRSGELQSCPFNKWRIVDSELQFTT